MSISLYNIKRWYAMLIGKSIYHVNQGVGKIYSSTEVKGYYNDLTEKITKDSLSSITYIPILTTEDNKKVEFPIAIFQYGLGSFDLFLLTEKDEYLKMFKNMVDWAVEMQNEDGSWDNFSYIYPNAPYSAMAQGEGVSLLVRAYLFYKESQYLIYAKKALEFMLKSLDEGGTTLYTDQEVIFKEYTHKPVVLNGWLFSLFGLYDYCKVDQSKEYDDILHKSVKSLVKHINQFDSGFWSYYDCNGMLASPFYHSLHIAQLEVAGEIFKCSELTAKSKKWTEYNDNNIYKSYAFFKKAYQKLIE
jgi:hypothetical protein